MTVTSRTWSSRPGVELIDLSTRWPLYLLSGSEPLLAMLVLGGQPSVRLPVAGPLLLVTLAHTVACVRLLRQALDQRLDGPDPRPRLLAGALILTAVGIALSVIVTPRPGDLLFDGGIPVGFALATMFACGLTLAVTPFLRLPYLALLVAIPAAVAAALQELTGATAQVPWAGNLLLIVTPFVLTYRFSAWVLGVMWELDRARGVATRLAVAEERLRVARDLHDVLGRNLTLISANSELAARLAARAPEAAVEKMLQMQELAQDSMREVRDVVGGARTADLDVELAGARSVLRSAGIDTRVIGDGTHLPAEAQSALGWVVREATTNVLRHAEPSRVRIEVGAATVNGQRVVSLRVENDGARDPRPPSLSGDGNGTGLAGLRDRLSRLGGTLVTERRGDGRFAVEARLPVGDEAAPGTHERSTG